MESIIEGLAQYGPLGLCAASLLWVNPQRRKSRKEDEKPVKEALTYHQKYIVNALVKRTRVLTEVYK